MTHDTSKITEKFTSFKRVFFPKKAMWETVKIALIMYKIIVATVEHETFNNIKKTFSIGK